ncbi:MAG: hypothetical protein SNJ74_03085 [Fimbriimonadaceae bacterium]
MPQVLASVDIGSNTAHLLVAEPKGGGLTRVTNESNWLSLGEVVSREGVIPDAVAQNICATLEVFRKVARSEGARGIYIFATEAVRTARNHDDLLRRIDLRIGIPVDVVQPRREAELTLRGASLDSDSRNPFLLVEVGGGSVQIARCVRGKVKEEQSLPLGTGRLTTETKLVHPVSAKIQRQLLRTIDERLEGIEANFEKTPKLVVAGGVARGLWRALHPDGARTLTAEELDYMIYATARLDVDTIAKRFQVKPRRAGTLLLGAVLYREIMRRFGFREALVSQYGVREGAVLEMAAGRIRPWPI